MSEFLSAAEEVRARVIDFCQRLVRTPSLSGQEGEVAALLQSEMQVLGYDEVQVDEIGNVIGVMRGRGGGTTVEMNGHMDVVDVGDLSRWPYPPFSAEIHDGAIWGRGASDMKGALAAMVYGVAALRRRGWTHQGDIYVATVVMEETGGQGTVFLTQHLHPDVAVVGEASRGALARGHRGRTEIVVTVHGRSVHASVPAQGANPHYTMAAFISGLRTIQLSRDAFLGPASLAPTLYISDQRSSNVIPGECKLHLDWRDVPADNADEFLAQLRSLLRSSLQDGCTGEVGISADRSRAYTGMESCRPGVFPSFVLAEDNPWLVRASQALEQAFGSKPPIIRWDFATDGGHLMKSGVPVIGYGPATGSFAHTVEDRIDIEALVQGVAGYAALAKALAEGA